MLSLTTALKNAFKGVSQENTKLHYLAMQANGFETAEKIKNYQKNSLEFDFEYELNLKNPNGRTALWIAVSKNDPILSKFLIEIGGDLDTTDVKHHCLVMAAVKNNAKDSLKVVLEHGCDPNGVFEASCCPLSIAARENHVECLLLLLKFGAIVDGREFLVASPIQKEVIRYQAMNRRGNYENSVQQRNIPPPPQIMPLPPPPPMAPPIALHFTSNMPLPPGPPPPPVSIPMEMSNSVSSIQSNDHSLINTQQTSYNNEDRIVDYPGAQSPLHTALIYNNEVCAALLIAYGADINLPHTSSSIVWLLIRYQASAELLRLCCSLGASMFDKINNQPIVIPDTTSNLDNLLRTTENRLDTPSRILPANKNCTVSDHQNLYAEQLDVLRGYYRQPMGLKEHARLAIRRQYSAKDLLDETFIRKSQRLRGLPDYSEMRQKKN